MSGLRSRTSPLLPNSSWIAIPQDDRGDGQPSSSRSSSPGGVGVPVALLPTRRRPGVYLRQALIGLTVLGLIGWLASGSSSASTTFRSLARTSSANAGAKKEGFLIHATSDPELKPFEEHPIHTLMKEAKAEWDDKVRKQSRTLDDAVREYRRRYRRDPPKGFEHWFKWAQENDVQMLDEYDSIADHVYPFLSLSPAEIRRRVKELERPGHGVSDHSILRIKNHQRLPWAGATWRLPTTEPWEDFVDDILQFLPDMEVPLYLHDGPLIVLDALAAKGYREAAERGELVNETALPTYEPSTWDDRARTCLPDSNLRREADGILNEATPGGPAFVADHYAEMDYCTNPKAIPLHGTTSIQPILYRLMPSVSMSRTPVNGDILCPASILYTLNPENESSFLDKPIHKIIWRGSPDGVAVRSDMNWRGSQRFRLLALTTSKDESRKRKVRMTRKSGLGGKEAQVDVEASLKELNERYMNIRPTNEAVQCEPKLCDWVNENLEFAPKMGLEEMAMHRYVMDVDGNAYSARFRTHLLSNQVVLKATRYPEWYIGRIQPWLHYVPASQDYSDLYNILAFFDGGLGPNREGHHDHLAAEIALAGRKWAETNWRLIDIKAYCFRLLLEFARLLEPERLPAYDA